MPPRSDRAPPLQAPPAGRFGPRRSNVPAIVMLCIGLVPLGLAAANLVSTLALLSRATAVQARFVGSVARPGGTHGGVFYYPRFAYRTPDGHERTFTNSTGATAQSYRDGQPVTVYVDPNAPDRPVLDSFWTLWAGTAVFGIFAIGFTVLPASLLWLGARCPRHRA